VCGPCLAATGRPGAAPPPAGVDAWGAAFSYEGVVRELVARLKYRDARSPLAFLADATASAAPAPPAGCVVTWVPATPAHRRARGFDHAELLARAVARRLGCRATALVRRPAGPAQTGRRRADRAAGPCVERGRGLARLRADAALVVDDVATTGASIRATAAVLREGGLRWIGAVTVARTPPPASIRARPAPGSRAPARP
jgi:predicted amidophosphoribosyltransferase